MLVASCCSRSCYIAWLYSVIWNCAVSCNTGCSIMWKTYSWTYNKFLISKSECRCMGLNLEAIYRYADVRCFCWNSSDDELRLVGVLFHSVGFCKVGCECMDSMRVARGGIQWRCVELHESLRGRVWASDVDVDPCDSGHVSSSCERLGSIEL
jgi:hypothetical protein